MSSTPSVEDLSNWFTYHAPQPGQVEVFQTIRDGGHEFADTLAQFVPPGPELDEAIKHVRAAVMWANAGIACANPDTNQGASS